MPMLFHPGMSFASRRSFAFAALDQWMPFHAVRGIPAAHRWTIGMHIHATVHPGAAPRPVVDIKTMRAPVKPAVSPSPRSEERAERYAKPKSDGSSDEKTRSRRGINHQRIVERHRYECCIYRLDLNVRTAAHHDLAVAPQIAKVLGLLPHSLHRVHHVLALSEKGIAQVGCPIHVRSHGVQHGWKREHCLYAGIKRQVVLGNSGGQRGSRQIVMLIR